MLFSTITTALLFAASVSGAALPRPPKPQKQTPAQNLDKLAALFPQSNLSAPSDLTLKYVVLGVGTQNYTCETPNGSMAPGTTGAFATLYDIGSKLNGNPNAKGMIASISSLALSLYEWAPDYVPTCLQGQGFQEVVGHHFFANVNGTNTPTFALDHLTAPYPMTQVAKIGGVDAPAGATPGTNGLPAVQWLYLQHKTGLSQGGINTVYRVETAGGNRPATCKGMPASWEVKYTAQYWIYGPK